MKNYITIQLDELDVVLEIEMTRQFNFHQPSAAEETLIDQIAHMLFDSANNSDFSKANTPSAIPD